MIHGIHREMGYTVPPYSVSNVMESLFPEVDVVGRPNMTQHAVIEVYPAALANGKRAVIAYNENDHHSTQRFSIAHELAHWLFDFRRGAFIPTESALACGGGRKSVLERRADYFAAELLAPLWVLDGMVSFGVFPDKEDEDAVARRDQQIQRLASRFNLSMKAMRNRVYSLHYWRKISR